MTEPRWPSFGAAALGFVWFLQLCGASSLNPLNTGWLFTGDWRQHWLGFLFFQREPWSFPLGTVSSLLYPLGTNIGFTDSNPLLAILIKPFAGLLPHEYQVIGLWLALCFVLQGYAGARLTSAITKDPGQQLLGGYFFVLSPVLFARLGHDTLCAQWVLLGLLYLGLREYRDRAKAVRAIWLAAAAVAFAAGVHPYLAAMAWVLSQAVMVRLWRARQIGFAGAAVGAVLLTAALLAVWGLVGYFGDTPDGSDGFGRYTADLLVLIDPGDYSRLLPPLPSTPGQWEGFGFLGVGGLIAFVAGTVALVKRRPAGRPGVGVVVAACVLLGIYSLSSSVRYGGNEVLDLTWLYEPLMPLIKPFRSSGRFIWPAHYLALAFGLWGVTRVLGRERTHLATLFLAAIVGLQAGDVAMDRWWLRRKPEPHVSVAPFELARGHYRHLALAPMQVLGVCRDPYQEDYVYRFMLLAHRLDLTFNSGIYARLDAGETRAVCETQSRDVDSGALDRETIYVVEDSEIERFKATGAAACGRWDGDWFCVSRKSDATFAAYISGEK